MDRMTARRELAAASPRIDTRRRTGGFLAVVALTAASCSSGSSDSSPSATDAAGTSETAVDADSETASTDGSIAPDTDDPSATANTEPLDDADKPDGPPAPASEALAELEPVRLVLPYVPPIALPDLSELNETGSAIESELGEFLDGAQGLDVLSAQCAAQGGELEYQASENGESFLDVETDGSGTYESFAGGSIVVVQVEADGSGTYQSTSPDANISIVVNADGSGTYEAGYPEENIAITVMPDGSGTYTSEHPERTLTVTINPDGSGSYASSTLAHDITIEVRPDGTGEYTSFSAAGTLSLESGADGSLTYVNSSPDIDDALVVNADGSGTYTESSGRGELSIEVDAAGDGIYDFRPIALDPVDVAFTSDIGILDPAVLEVSPLPTFSVASRFPPFSALGSLQPPCVTVIRLSSSVLFDEGSDELRPESFPVIDQLATALIATDASIEVHGHTDSLGSDEFNLDLSERRAMNFANALVERGVTSEIVSLGFGETRPVAPNTTEDGEDDPTGRQLNRRVEVVVTG